MNYYDIINKIKSTALQHNLVNESAEGDVYEWMNSKNHKYPCVFITIENVTVEDDLNTLTANLIYLDRLTDNKDNKLKIQSIGVTVLKQIINKLNEDGIECDTGTYEPFTDEKADVCAGVIARVDFSYEGEDLCEGDFVPKTLEITQNGEYDVTGYDKAEVNVDVLKLENADFIKITDCTIDTGIYFNDLNFRVEIAFTPLTTTNYGYQKIFGVIGDDENKTQISRYLTTDLVNSYGGIPGGYMHNVNDYSDTLKLVNGKRIDNVFQYPYSYAYSEGIEYKSIKMLGDDIIKGNFALLPLLTSKIDFNLHYLRIYHNNELVFKGEPKYNKMTDTFFLVDEISGKFLYSMFNNQQLTTLEAQPNFINLNVTEEEYNAVMPIIEDMHKDNPEQPIIAE